MKHSSYFILLRFSSLKEPKHFRDYPSKKPDLSFSHRCFRLDLDREGVQSLGKIVLKSFFFTFAHSAGSPLTLNDRSTGIGCIKNRVCPMMSHILTLK